MAGIYAGTGRYQAWLAYPVAPRSAGGIEPAGSAGHWRWAPCTSACKPTADLDGWAALGQLYLYRARHANAPLAYQQPLPRIVGRQRGDPGCPGYRALILPGRPAALTPEALRLLDSALKQDKGEVSALMLLASDHFLHGRYSQAIALWQQLLDEERPASTGPR